MNSETLFELSNLKLICTFLSSPQQCTGSPGGSPSFQTVAGVGAYGSRSSLSACSTIIRATLWNGASTGGTTRTRPIRTCARAHTRWFFRTRGSGNHPPYPQSSWTSQGARASSYSSKPHVCPCVLPTHQWPQPAALVQNVRLKIHWQPSTHQPRRASDRLLPVPR